MRSVFEAWRAASDGGKRLPGLWAQGASAIGAPSARISLGELHACRARLRFTWRTKLPHEPEKAKLTRPMGSARDLSQICSRPSVWASIIGSPPSAARLSQLLLGRQRIGRV